jgi:hypothetical protein
VGRDGAVVEGLVMREFSLSLVGWWIWSWRWVLNADAERVDE